MIDVIHLKSGDVTLELHQSGAVDVSSHLQDA